MLVGVCAVVGLVGVYVGGVFDLGSFMVFLVVWSGFRMGVCACIC